eukprot:gene9145-biopygen5460
MGHRACTPLSGWLVRTGLLTGGMVESSGCAKEHYDMICWLGACELISSHNTIDFVKRHLEVPEGGIRWHLEVPEGG